MFLKDRDHKNSAEWCRKWKTNHKPKSATSILWSQLSQHHAVTSAFESITNIFPKQSEHIANVRLVKLKKQGAAYLEK